MPGRYELNFDNPLPRPIPKPYRTTGCRNPTWRPLRPMRLVP